MKSRRFVIWGVIVFLVLVLAYLFLRYEHIQHRSAFDFISVSGNRQNKLHCLFEQPITEDLTLVAYRDENQCAYVKIVQKGLFNDYSCGVTQGGYSLVDIKDCTEDSIKEKDYIRIDADELSRDPGKRHQSKEPDKILLVWGIVYDNSVASVELWGKRLYMIALPGYSSRICYFITADYEENFSIDFSESDKNIVLRWQY